MIYWSDQHCEECEVLETPTAFQACDISIMGCSEGMFTCIFQFLSLLKFIYIVINFYPTSNSCPTSKVIVHCYQFLSNFWSFCPISEVLVRFYQFMSNFWGAYKFLSSWHGKWGWTVHGQIVESALVATKSSSSKVIYNCCNNTLCLGRSWILCPGSRSLHL